jgi:cellulase/cellobiase CelA1
VQNLHLADTSDWASGFVGSVDITNNAINPVNGWRLDFTWPTGWQQLGSGWHGTWSQTGATVHVTNADFNATLAAGGGQTNVGFVGNYSGPNILPVMFTLNGTVCATI